MGVGLVNEDARFGDVVRSGFQRSRLSQTLARIWFGG
ncbi:hypothetical protein ACVWYT_007519 [Streptomyces sp. TE4109]